MSAALSRCQTDEIRRRFGFEATQDAGITVLACAIGGRINLRPSANTLIEPGMRLIVLGTRDQLQELIAAAGQPGISISLASPDTRSSK